MSTICNKLAMGVVVILAFSQQGSRAMASELPTNVQRTREIIEARFSEIIQFGHHYTTNRGVDYDGARKLDDGYALTFTFRWDGGVRANQYTKIRFLVENSGRVLSLSVEGTSCLWIPFETDLTLSDVQARRSMLARHPRVKDSVRMLQTVNSATARHLCQLYLNLERGVE